MSASHRAVAIDGPAASGKSTVAKCLAARLGLIMVNSGAMYRAVTWQILQDGILPSDQDAVIQAFERMKIICGVEDGVSTISVNGRTLSSELRTPAVNENVSTLASFSKLREGLVAMQRAYLESDDVVMEGRDIGSVVFPETPFKIYIDASEEVRAARRSKDGEADVVAERDAQDSQREASPLKISEGAIVIDSSSLTIDQTVLAAQEALIELGWED